MLGIIILVYVLISIAAFIWVFFDTPLDTPVAMYKNLYYKLREKYNLAGTIIPIIFFTILCLPEFIICYSIIFCGCFVTDFIPWIWGKMFGRSH